MTQFSYAQDSIPPAPKPEVIEEVVTPPATTEPTEKKEEQPTVVPPKKEEQPIVTPPKKEESTTVVTPQIVTPIPVSPSSRRTTTTGNQGTNQRTNTTSVQNTPPKTPIAPDINNGAPNPFALFSKKKRIKRATQISFLPKGFVQTKKSKSKPKEKEPEVVEPVPKEIQEVEEQVIVPVDTSTTALNAKNPFGIRGVLTSTNKKGYNSRKIAFNPAAGAGTKESKKAQRQLLFDTSKVNTLGTLKFGLLLTILGLLAMLMSIFREDANNMYKAFISNNIMVLLLREKGHLIHIPYVLTYLIFSLSAGTFIYLVAGYFDQSIMTDSFNALSLCVFGVMGFFLLKHFLLGFIGFVFPFGNEITLYNFSLGIFNGILGIILIPFIAFLAFAPSNLQTIILYSGIIMIGIFYIYRLFRYLDIANKFLGFHKFHFFVYLCTVEIAPMVILLKYILP